MHGVIFNYNRVTKKVGGGGGLGKDKMGGPPLLLLVLPRTLFPLSRLYLNLVINIIILISISELYMTERILPT